MRSDCTSLTPRRNITHLLPSGSLYANKTQRLTRSKAGLLVIDIQDKLLRLYSKRSGWCGMIVLIKGAGILQVPVFATEQYAKVWD